MEQSPSREALNHSVNKLPDFYGTQRFITVSTSPQTPTGPYPKPHASSPYLPTLFT